MVFNKWGNLYKVYPPYLGSKDKVKVLCNKCGNTFEIRPNNLLSGHGTKR